MRLRLFLLTVHQSLFWIKPTNVQSKVHFLFYYITHEHCAVAYRVRIKSEHYHYR